VTPLRRKWVELQLGQHVSAFIMRRKSKPEDFNFTEKGLTIHLESIEDAERFVKECEEKQTVAERTSNFVTLSFTN
jgi:hypothetical protein